MNGWKIHRMRIKYNAIIGLVQLVQMIGLLQHARIGRSDHPTDNTHRIKKEATITHDFLKALWVYK